MAEIKKSNKMYMVVPENPDESKYLRKFNHKIPFTAITGQTLVYIAGVPQLFVKTFEKAIFWKKQVELQVEM